MPKDAGTVYGAAGLRQKLSDDEMKRMYASADIFIMPINSILKPICEQNSYFLLAVR